MEPRGIAKLTVTIFIWDWESTSILNILQVFAAIVAQILVDRDGSQGDKISRWTVRPLSLKSVGMMNSSRGFRHRKEVGLAVEQHGELSDLPPQRTTNSHPSFRHCHRTHTLSTANLKWSHSKGPTCSFKFQCRVISGNGTLGG